jgi:hypothetical protein
MLKYNKIGSEYFTVPTVTSPTVASPTVTSPTVTSPTVTSEDPIVMPKTNSIAIYMNAFQDVDGKIPSYLPGANSWNDFGDPDNKKFTLMSTSTPPAQLSDGGFPLKNFKLQGPPSNSLGTADFNSFTISIYAKVNSLDLSAGFIKVLQIYAETPNYIILLFDKNNDTTKVNVVAHIRTKTYGWILPKTSIIGTNLLSLMYNYNNGSPTVDFFINDTVQVLDATLSSSDSVSDTTSTYSTIKLGLSPIVLNSTLNLDANMYAFVIYSVNLTTPSSPSITGDSDLTLLKKHFISEVAGYSRLLLLKQQTDSQNNSLKAQMDKYKKNIKSYKADLDKCTSKLQDTAASNLADSITAATKSQLRKWQIDYNGTAALDTADTKSLDSCSPIHVKSFGSSKSDDAKSSSNMKSFPEQSSLTSYSLRYPSDDIASSKAAKPDTSSKTTNTSTEEATKVITKPTLWESIRDIFVSK